MTSTPTQLESRLQEEVDLLRAACDDLREQLNELVEIAEVGMEVSRAKLNQMIARRRQARANPR